MGKKIYYIQIHFTCCTLVVMIFVYMRVFEVELYKEPILMK